MVSAVAAAALLAAASPVPGSVFGPIVSVKGDTFMLTTKLSPDGRSIVSAGSARITEQAAASRSALKVGVCVAANGARSTKGVVTAARIMISLPVKGQCAGPTFRGRGGGSRPPRTGTPPPGGFRRNGNFGFAFGSVKTVTGSTLSVKGPFGATTVTTSAKTSYFQTKTVNASALTVKTCAFVRGTSSNKGITVEATDIAVTPETNGTCATGFRRPGS